MIDVDKGDYGRGGVEAIRRLLHKDACIGADLTMVKLIVFTIVLFSFDHRFVFYVSQSVPMLLMQLN